MPRSRPILSALLCLAAVLPGCGDDSSSGPSGVTFPTLPSALLNAYCVRGERTPGQAISSTLANTDCDYGDGTFYEVWRVRVATTGQYDFAANSAFDNLLAVLRLESYTSSSATLTTIASDDDGSGGTNALISNVTLQAGTDYFLVVNGFNPTDVGPYTVTFSGP